jgi:UDP-N-acetylmuramate dehydrogenase
MQHFEALKKTFPEIPFYPVDGNEKIVKVPAAWLIEQCGLKGYSNGKAGISQKHALIVVNDGGSAKEVLEVVQHVQTKVKEIFGVELTSEAVYV